MSSSETHSLAVLEHHQRLNISVAAISVLTFQMFDSDPVTHPGIARVLGSLRRAGVVMLANGGNCRTWWTNCTGLPWPARVSGIIPVGAATFGKNRSDSTFAHRGAALKSLDSCNCNEEVYAVCGAAYTSGALPVFAASVLLMQEAIDRSGYAWQRDGKTRHEAILAIIRQTAAPLSPCVAGTRSCLKLVRKCKRGRYCIRLSRALKHILGGSKNGLTSL